MKIGIFPNIYKEDSYKIIDKLISMNNNNMNFFVDESFRKDLDNKYLFDKISNADVVLTLGGDGTLIKAMRKCACFNIPILGIHLGHLGFLVEVQKDEINQAIEKLFNREYIVEDRMMLKVDVIKDDGIIESYIALNDIVLTRKSTSRMICTGVWVNEMLLDNYYADGVIVATPTGSTGYSLSAGGPIVDPSMNVMVITPICPHTLHSRAIVINENKDIVLQPDLKYNNDTIITIDGQIDLDITEGMKIVVSKSNINAKFIKINEYNFYKLLRNKLFERGNK